MGGFGIWNKTSKKAMKSLRSNWMSQGKVPATNYIYHWEITLKVTFDNFIKNFFVCTVYVIVKAHLLFTI